MKLSEVWNTFYLYFQSSDKKKNLQIWNSSVEEERQDDPFINKDHTLNKCPRRCTQMSSKLLMDICIMGNHNVLLTDFFTMRCEKVSEKNSLHMGCVKTLLSPAWLATLFLFSFPSHAQFPTFPTLQALERAHIYLWLQLLSWAPIFFLFPAAS